MPIELYRLGPYEMVVLEALVLRAGNALTAGKNVGQPNPFSREQTHRARESSNAPAKETFVADANGRFQIERPLARWSMILVSIFENEEGSRASGTL